MQTRWETYYFIKTISLFEKSYSLEASCIDKYNRGKNLRFIVQVIWRWGQFTGQIFPELYPRVQLSVVAYPSGIIMWLGRVININTNIF